MKEITFYIEIFCDDASFITDDFNLKSVNDSILDYDCSAIRTMISL